jgi:hypothetical protein
LSPGIETYRVDQTCPKRSHSFRAYAKTLSENHRFNPRISAPLRRVLLLCRYVLFSA